MQIIDELEWTSRRSYSGSVGHINRDGSFDLNILYVVCCYVLNQLSFRAGADIVADSGPQYRLDETRVKAKGFLRVLGLA